jgi:hypothetical protein
MRFRTPVLIAGLLVAAALPLKASRVHRGPTAPKKKSSSASKPRAMDDARAMQIQTALVKAGYLTEATGHWDADSQAAMQKLQADNGWQTKIVPDSRALIKLGLGPGTQTAEAAATLTAGPAAPSDAEGTK